MLAQVISAFNAHQIAVNRCRVSLILAEAAKNFRSTTSGILYLRSSSKCSVSCIQVHTLGAALLLPAEEVRFPRPYRTNRIAVCILSSYKWFSLLTERAA